MPKDVISYLITTFNLERVNWGLQMKLAKSLLTKYSFNEVKYAIDYYKQKGEDIYSLGFLLHKTNMKDPVSLYKAEQNMQENNNSGDRNWQRIRQNSKAKRREDYPCSLFEESSDDN